MIATLDIRLTPLNNETKGYAVPQHRMKGRDRLGPACTGRHEPNRFFGLGSVMLLSVQLFSSANMLSNVTTRQHCPTFSHSRIRRHFRRPRASRVWRVRIALPGDRAFDSLEDCRDLIFMECKAVCKPSNVNRYFGILDGTFSNLCLPIKQIKFVVSPVSEYGVYVVDDENCISSR
jgi:hypothetical protein